MSPLSWSDRNASGPLIWKYPEFCRSWRTTCSISSAARAVSPAMAPSRRKEGIPSLISLTCWFPGSTMSTLLGWSCCGGCAGGSWAKMRGSVSPRPSRAKATARWMALDLMSPLACSIDDQVDPERVVLVSPGERGERRGALHGPQDREVEGIVPRRLGDAQIGDRAVPLDLEVDDRLDLAHVRALPLRVDQGEQAVQVVAEGEVGVLDADAGAERRAADRAAGGRAAPAELVAALAGSDARRRIRRGAPRWLGRFSRLRLFRLFLLRQHGNVVRRLRRRRDLLGLFLRLGLRLGLGGGLLFRFFLDRLGLGRRRPRYAERLGRNHLHRHELQRLGPWLQAGEEDGEGDRQGVQQE